MKEKMLSDELQRLHQRQMLGVDVRDVVSVIEEMLMSVRGEIAEKAAERIPKFINIARELGLTITMLRCCQH